jgi:hypothetical protein
MQTRKPNQYRQPTMNTLVQFGDHTSLQLHDRTVRPQDLAATDPAIYVNALCEAAEEHLNGPDWRAAAEGRTPCEFRPYGAAPTGQQIITMANRTVAFDPRKNWDNEVVEEGEVIAGSYIFTEPTDKALVISHRATILDHNIISGWTANSMEQTAEKILADIQMEATASVAKILADAPSTETVTAEKPTGKPAAVAEDLIDILTMNINQAVGNSLSHFAVMLPASLVGVLERAAQRAGLPDVEDLIGATILPYTGTDRGIFMLPRMFTSLSYRERADGRIWKIIPTRNASMQAWEIEVMTVVDIIANGKVQVALTGDKLQTETVDFPLITRITWNVPVTGVSLKNPTKELEVGTSYTNSYTVAPSDASDQTVSWSSSDTSVATVSATGSVLGVAEGTTTVTCTTTDGGFTASYVVTVVAAGTDVADAKVKAKRK